MAPPTEEVLIKAIYPSLFVTHRNIEQNKPAPQRSNLLFDPLWKATQVKEIII